MPAVFYAAAQLLILPAKPSSELRARYRPSAKPRPKPKPEPCPVSRPFALVFAGSQAPMRVYRLPGKPVAPPTERAPPASGSGRFTAYTKNPPTVSSRRA